jgi:hypothetical protein
MVSMGTMLFINKWGILFYFTIKKKETSGVGGSTIVIREQTFGCGIRCHRRVVCKWVLE